MSAEITRPKLDAEMERVVNAWAERIYEQGNVIVREPRQTSAKKWKLLKTPRYLFRP